MVTTIRLSYSEDGRFYIEDAPDDVIVLLDDYDAGATFPIPRRPKPDVLRPCRCSVCIEHRSRV